MTQWNKWSYYLKHKVPTRWRKNEGIVLSCLPPLPPQWPSLHLCFPLCSPHSRLRDILKHKLDWVSLLIKASHCLLVKDPSLIKPWMSSRKCFFFFWFHLVLLNLHPMLPETLICFQFFQRFYCMLLRFFECSFHPTQLSKLEPDATEWSLSCRCFPTPWGMLRVPARCSTNTS